MRQAHHLPLPVEAPLAVVASVASFALAGAAFTGIGSNLASDLVALAYLAVVVALARLVSIAYAVPLAMAGLLAYDWFRVVPTHPYEFPDSANLVQLTVYIGVAVLIGEIAGLCLRRAERSERARGVIADEQTALRRVATLVARQAPEEKIFAAVVQEVGRLLSVEDATMLRYEDDRRATVVASWGSRGADKRSEPGIRKPLGGTNVTTLVHRTGLPARIDDYSEATGAIGEHVRELGLLSAVGAPIEVEGRLWGVMVVGQERAPLAPATRVAPREVHRADRHGDREHPGSCRPRGVKGPCRRRGPQRA